MRWFIFSLLAAALGLSGCQRERSEQTAVELVRAGAPEACSHPEPREALAARLPGSEGVEEITFSGFDQERLRVRCEILTQGRRVSFEVAQNLARPGQVTVILGAPAEPATAAGAEASPSPRPAPRSAIDAPAGARGYTYDVPETYPAAFALWRQQVSDLPLDDRPWARTLKGTAAPVRKVSVAGADYLRGWVCEPHNCGGNEVILLISPGQTRVLGLIRLTGPDRRVTDYPVGSPSALEARCLDFYLEDRSDAQQCP